MGKRWSSARRSDLRRDWQGFGYFHKKYFRNWESFEFVIASRYLREALHLTGTKISCGQGGCGSCLVTAKVSKSHPCPLTIIIVTISVSLSLSWWILSCHCNGVKVSQSLLSPCNPSLIPSGSRSSNWDEEDQSCQLCKSVNHKIE